METSIETIWKEGFLNNDALVAPKLNSLYGQKSIHIIDKFKRMFKVNIILIVLGSVIVLTGSLVIEMPFAGTAIFLLLNVMAIVDGMLLNGLNKVDNNRTSYQYLKKFDDWMKHKTVVNTMMARIVYPYLFISMTMGFWFKNIDGNTLGEKLVNNLLVHHPDTYLVFGIPLFGIVVFLVISGLLVFFGKHLYRLDVNIAYGQVLRKLDELLADMEELRN